MTEENLGELACARGDRQWDSIASINRHCKKGYCSVFPN